MTVLLLFPDQLFELKELFPTSTPVYLVEDPLFWTQFRFHQHKLLFHRASMKAYQAELEAQGYHVLYLDFTQLQSVETSPQKQGVSVLLRELKEAGVTTLNVFEPIDDWRQQKLQLLEAKFKLTYHDSPAFLGSSKLYTHFFGNRQHYSMTQFYIWQRQRLQILVDHGQPIGGRWSFDTENRARLPRDFSLPAEPVGYDHHFTSVHDKPYLEEAHQYCQKYFKSNYGQPTTFFYPVTRHAANEWLPAFLQERVADFGKFEDAIAADQHRLFHSILSPLLNVGLLTPTEVVQATLRYAHNHSVPLQSLEGFLRQIIGWREFMMASYLLKGRKMRTGNFFDHHRPLPESFWTGQTGLLPFDQTVKKVLQTGYAHHIERLMILGNLMLLCEIEPTQVYEWFMTLFIDAYDWVMVPNVYAMSQFADPSLTTKPYFSSSRYILKMSDYPKGDWCQTWDGLYWRFILKHLDFFSKNPRLGMMAVQWNKMASAKQAEHLRKAEEFLGKLRKEKN